MPKPSSIAFFFITASLVLSPVSLTAVDYPSPPSPDIYIKDEPGVISPEDETRINDLCREVEYITTAEMAVLVVSTTYGEPHWLYATEVGNHWGVGQAEGDNGLLMLVAIDDRQVFTATGSGMEGIIPDITIDRIYRNILVPNFKKDYYGEGIYQALQLYAVEIERYYEVELAGTQGAPRFKGKGGVKRFIWPAIIGIIVLGFVALTVWASVTSKGSGSSSNRSYWSSSSSSSSTSSSSSSSGFSGGGFSGGSFSGGGGGGGW